MSVDTLSSLLMLDRCAHYSKIRMKEVSLHEPDDQVEQYIDFLERINPADWGNDDYLLELIDNVFSRKKEAGERIFLNPPYGSEAANWVAKAYFESQYAEVIVGLLPARTDARWFHDFVYGKAEIRFIKGRLKFVGPNGSGRSATFPSMVVVWRNKNLEQVDHGVLLQRDEQDIAENGQISDSTKGAD